MTFKVNIKWVISVSISSDLSSKAFWETEACRLEMKTPASWYGDRAKDSLPCGNGLTGLLCPGGIASEQLLLTRHDLWHQVGRAPLPDISHTLAQARSAIDRGDWKTGNEIACQALQQAGYEGKLGFPCPLGGLTLTLDCPAPFSHYRRSLWMDTGEVKMKWRQQGAEFARRQFVSRACDLAVLEQTCSAQLLSGSVRLGLYQDGTPATQEKRRQVGDTLRVWQEAGRLCYQARNDDGLWFGAVLEADCDGQRSFEQDSLFFSGCSRLLLRCACFSKEPDPRRAVEAAAQKLKAQPKDYSALLAPHLTLHQPLFFSAGLSLEDRSPDRCNEEELLLAYEEQAGNRLLEKLWHFGRYLFVSGSAQGALPFPLYGLWCSGYQLAWCQHVANENVEMIYWHQPVGGLAPLMEPLLDYYVSQMEDFRENARRLFGCRGIYVSAYTCPGCGLSTLNVPVILNWTGAAGWLSRHFTAYCQETGNRAALREKALPFMREAALFYEDFVCYQPDGKVKLYPSVSPENSPGNFMPEHFSEHMGHVMPSAVNATMDFAILKDLLTSLLSLSRQEGAYQEDWPRWEALLAALPDYQVNGQGAVKEWMDPHLGDFYKHRHLSHLYPVFPGDEVTAETRPDLWDAFEKAVELRELGGQSGWSMAHMANLYARFGRGEQAVQCLDLLCRSCMTNSLFTLHNDWRDMGLSLTIPDMSVRQLDANMGLVSALQEMLFFAGRDGVKLLPACPSRFVRGAARDFCGCGLQVSFSWDQERQQAQGVLAARQDVSLTLTPPPFAPWLSLGEGPRAQGPGSVSMKKGERLAFSCDGGEKTGTVLPGNG